MEILKDLDLNKSLMTSNSETEIFQGVIDYESLRDGISHLAGLGRIAPRDLGVPAVMASRNGQGRWLKVVHEGKSWSFPVSKKVPVGTSPKDLMYGVTIPSVEHPDVTLIGYLPNGNTEVFF